MKSFAVITPTIGTEYLRKCIESLADQDCEHYLFVDGIKHLSAVQDILHSGPSPSHARLHTNIIAKNIGKGWYGHRVYSAASFLVNEDVLCYMDEDNWAEPNYIQEFQEVFNDPKYQWAYTLRRIAAPDGKVIGPDNCESLGHWPVSFSGGTRFHIDTGCFAIPRELAVKVGHNWYGQWGADRQFFAAVKAQAPEFGCTMKHTLNYRLGSETSRATTEMFLHGDKLSQQAYIGERDYPWHEQRSPKKSPTQFTYQTTNQKPL